MKTIHSTNANLRMLQVNRDLVVAAGVNVMGFVIREKQGKNVFVAGTFPKSQKKIIANGNFWRVRVYKINVSKTLRYEQTYRCYQKKFLTLIKIFDVSSNLF